MKFETDYVRVAPDVRLFFRRMGADGPTILLLHGWPQTGHAWRHVLPTLAASGHVVVAPDLRGAGDSDKPTNGYDARTRMEDVRTLLGELGLADEPIFVVGHGDGGVSAAQAFAVEHPEEVAALAVLSAPPLGIRIAASDWLTSFHQVPDLPETLIYSHLELYLRHFFRAWSHDPNMMSEADFVVYVQALAAPGALRASLAPFRALPADHEHFRDRRRTRRPNLPNEGIACPLLLLRGDSDPRTEAVALEQTWKSMMQRDWEKKMQVQAIARGGFWLPEERPDPTAAALLAFFEEVRNERNESPGE